MYGCVSTESADAPPLTISNAISTGSVISLILPNAGDENFTSVINAARSDFVILFPKSIPEFGRESSMS